MIVREDIGREVGWVEGEKVVEVWELQWTYHLDQQTYYLEEYHDNYVLSR